MVSVVTRATVVNILHDDFDVYIGREVPEHEIAGSKWGNPFILADETEAERQRVIGLYRDWIATQPELMGALVELRGKRLACWCAPKACHGDVLVELAENL
ncbi:MAG: DUF4326 domain-containing protein [Actinomycetia bacterium]|nr:DUF4326 domain-containing protein [Actinomycetes bacterium]MCP4962343.1 DUF4326 domain-containing protein [Actinomycetes bacterium]